jgi:hypothetical protein
MKKVLITSIVVAALTGMSNANADGLKQQVVGMWSLVSQAVEKPDGSRVERFGSNPKGIGIFDQNGRFSMIMLRSDLPKVASNNAMTGTPEENKAIIHGSTAFFGSWSVDEATSTMINRVDGSTFPNWDGTELKRSLTISGDDMKICVPSQIGGTSCAVWRRLR